MKTVILFFGDLVALYLGLFLMLFVRYGGNFYQELLRRHLLPFSIVFVFWIIVFYIGGLYDVRRLRNNLEFFKTLSAALSVAALLAIVFFYLIPFFGIAPKTNLFLFFIIFAVLETLWRQWFNRFVTSREPPLKVALVGTSATGDEIIEFLKTHPQLGYEIKFWLKEDALPKPLDRLENWEKLIHEHQIDFVVIPHHLKKESRFAKLFYELLPLGIHIYDVPSFYEVMFQKVPLQEINEGWFLETIAQRPRWYRDAKRAAELTAALLLGIILLPLELLVALLIKLSSKGPTIYRQVRVGQGRKEFILYKFRTMRHDAEKEGPQWAKEGDKRSTTLGQLLRFSHLDELPQLWNIVRGELSFVGPRPERPEFVQVLREKIPYYDIRHLIKPGITGWAQINYRYGASIEDAVEKLQYDIYYLKNRSFTLDCAIVLKTLKSFFVSP